MASFPAFLVDSVGNGLAGAHDFQLFLTGDFCCVIREEVGVCTTDAVRGGTYTHFFCGSLIGHHKAGFAVLVVDVVGQVVNEIAEQIPVLHGMHICHFAAGNVNPYAHELFGLLVATTLQQAIHPNPFPAPCSLVEQADFNAQWRRSRAIQIALNRIDEVIPVFFMNGELRGCENVGSQFAEGNSHHSQTLLGVVNFAVFDIPAVHAFLCGAQSFAYQSPVKYTGYGIAGSSVIGIAAHRYYFYAFARIISSLNLPRSLLF